MPTVLIVDDERNIRDLLRMYLEVEGYKVLEAPDGTAALQMLDGPTEPDLVILDLMLPGLDGWEVCRRIRSGRRPMLPVLMLTARDEDVDKIVGLELGADDYVTKPFNPREVTARVKAILRRTKPSEEPLSEDIPLVVGDVVLDPRRRTVSVGGKSVTFRRKEFDLLEALMRHRDLVLTRDQLLEQVWGYDYPGQTRTVDVHIAALRRKLAGSRAKIETVVGVGYRLTEGA